MTDIIRSFYHEQLLYSQSKVSDDVLGQIKEEVKYILEDESSRKLLPKSLIQKEYGVHKLIPSVRTMSERSQKILKHDLIALANKHHNIIKEDENYPHWTLTGPSPGEWKGMWINFQKKHEHFPLHEHGGNLSFVMWVQIPYDLQKELKLSNCKHLHDSSNSLFNFVHTNIFGQIVDKPILVDKSYEGTIIIFNSNLRHIVYPFYTSDDYRISISGNLIAGLPIETNIND